MKKDNKNNNRVIDLEELIQDKRDKFYEDRDKFYGNWYEDEAEEEVEAEVEADIIKFQQAEEAMTMFEMCQPGGMFDFSRIEI